MTSGNETQYRYIQNREERKADGHLYRPIAPVLPGRQLASGIAAWIGMPANPGPVSEPVSEKAWQNRLKQLSTNRLELEATIGPFAKIYHSHMTGGSLRDYAEVGYSTVIRCDISNSIIQQSSLYHSRLEAGSRTSRVVGDNFFSSGIFVTHARIPDDAHLLDNRDILTLGPLGSEDHKMTLARTQDGHTLVVGCWTGTIYGLMDEVRSRITKERVGDKKCQLLIAEYEATLPLLKARLAEWGQA